MEKYMREDFFSENIDKNASLSHKLSDRDYWNSLDGEFYSWLKGMDEYKKTAYNILNISDYIKYFTEGNRIVFEAPYFNRRSELMRLYFMEAIKNNGEYFDDILNLTWAILEETIWSVPAHKKHSGNDDVIPHEGTPSLELFTAETAGILTTVYYTFKEKFDEISPEFGERIKRKVKNEIYLPYIEKDLNWMGFGRIPNNWNPWISSNVVKCVINLKEYTELEYKVLARSVFIINKYISNYPQDGGCDEGAGYWSHAGGSFIIYTDIMNKITGGKMNLAEFEKIQNLAEFYMKVYTSKEHILGFSDTILNYGQCWPFMWYVGKVMNNDKIKAFAKHNFLSSPSLENIEVSRSSSSRIVFIGEALAQIKDFNKEYNFEKDVYYDSIKTMVAREKETAPFGLFLAAKMNHNKESHNHLDTGSFIVYKNEVPFLVDAGNKTYTAKTFSDKRYEIWNTRSIFHSIPVIGGCEEKLGENCRGENVIYENSSISGELKSAYREDFIKSFKRKISLDREKKQVVLEDSFSLEEEQNIEFIFITPANVTISDKIYLENQGEKLAISFDKSFTFDIQNIVDDDIIITRTWGSSLKRVILKTKTSLDTFKFIIE